MGLIHALMCGREAKAPGKVLRKCDLTLLGGGSMTLVGDQKSLSIAQRVVAITG
ncbi:unannotated protein [freshwater metagenome]|uniref:Unannotated protein n=1 Tax=freshwater metagenome TaxID=449393 RepID=A0A6J7E7W9_9ZZZZ